MLSLVFVVCLCCVVAFVNVDQFQALMSLYTGIGCDDVRFCPRFSASDGCPDIGVAFGKIPRLQCDPATGDITHVAVFGSESTLVGTLNAAAIQGLSALTYLEIFGSRGVGGTIPAAAIGSLRNLQYLDLMGCAFTGTIGPEIARATNLMELYFASNRLFGTVPQALATLPLDYVWAFENRLTGPFPEFTIANNCTAMGTDDAVKRPDSNCFSECSPACCRNNSTRCPFSGPLEPKQTYGGPRTRVGATMSMPPTTTARFGQTTVYLPPPLTTPARTPPLAFEPSPAPATKTRAALVETTTRAGAGEGEGDALLGLWIFLGVCAALTVLGLLLLCYIRRSTDREYPRDAARRRAPVNSVVFGNDAKPALYEDMSVSPKNVLPPAPFYDAVADTNRTAELRIDRQQHAESMELRLKPATPSAYSEVPALINVPNDFYGADPALNEL